MARETRPGPGAFIKIMHFVRPRMAGYLIGLLVFSFTEVSFNVSIPYVEKLMIDAAVAKDLSGLWRGIAFILGVSAVGAISFVLFMYLFCVSVYRITATIRTRDFGHAIELPAAYHEKRHSGDTLSRLTNDVNTLRNSYDWPLFNLIVILLAGTGAAAAMLALDWRVSSFLIVSSVAFAALNAKFSNSIKKVSAEIQKSLGALTESMADVIGGFAVIKQFGLRDRMIGRFEGRNADIRLRSKRRAGMSAWLETYNALIGWVNFGGVLALGAFLAGKRFMSFGTMVALVNYLWNVNRMIRQTGSAIAQFGGYVAGADRVLELERESEEGSPELAYRRGGRPGVAVEMRNVSFSYDGKRKALDGFDLVAEEGRTVALVGPSGGGKSTVCKLLLGFHLPDSGEIRVVPGESGFRGIRETMAYVPQDPFMFDGSVADNIGYGKPGAGMDQIVRAAKSADAHEFIEKFEKGYDTVVGERGVKLSGGQRQRIAIARAFLKDAPVMLLDEATSSLDSHSERSIQSALRELGGKKTVIVIAHRLSTVRDADAIYVIDSGRVLERGRHEELLSRRGMYWKLHELQFEPSGAPS